MVKNSAESNLEEIKKLAQDQIILAADALYDFAVKFAPSSQMVFKSSFIKAGLVIAAKLDNKENKQQAFDKLRVQILILAHDITDFNNKNEANNQATQKVTATKFLIKTYHGNKKIVIECKNIKKTFKGEKFKLGPINFDFRLGEITGVVGLNSHGKSTMLKIIGGRLSPDSGEVIYSSRSANEKLKIGFLPQELPFEYGTVKSNLHLAASLAGIYAENNEHEVQYLIYRLGLFEKENTKISLLSGGFKLRYAICKLLVAQPNVLILDEPLANLDFIAQSSLLTDLYSLARNKNNPVSIIITSQHIEEVETVADNMMVLKNGELVYAGKTNNIYSEKSDNLFEFRSKHEFKELQKRFKNLEHHSLTEESFYSFIYTPKHVTRDVFLSYCHHNQIDIMLFNDMSGSVKRLILENTIE